jgi:AcrR family transcriptional regulator
MTVPIHAAASSAPAGTARPGRPRDPELDERVLDAALTVYARHGWAGFNFDTVAREAGCGRPALYRRWRSKRELMLAAFKAFDATLDVTDEGSIRDQLAAVAEQLFRHYLSQHGSAIIRMAMDGVGDEELWGEWDAIRRARIRTAREIVKRGIERGELMPNTSASKLLNSITGAMLSEAMTVPPLDRQAVLAAARTHAEQLVDFLLFEAPGLTPSHHRVAAAGRTPA